MEEQSRKKEDSDIHAHPQAHLEIRWLHLVSLENSLSPASCSLFSPDGPLKVPGTRRGSCMAFTPETLPWGGAEGSLGLVRPASPLGGGDAPSATQPSV